MRSDGTTNSPPARNAFLGQSVDPFSGFLNSTMSSGLSVYAHIAGTYLPLPLDVSDYVTLRADVLLEYERTILELRQELVHYRRLISKLFQPQEAGEEYPEASPVLPLDAASIRLVDSIVEARVPSSATFVDFEEGEL